MLDIVGHAGTGHQVQIGEGRVQALAGAGVKLAERGVAVDEQDGVVGGGLGDGGEAAGWVLSGQDEIPKKRKIWNGR